MSDAGSAIRRIMVALDTHPWNLAALEELAELARGLRAELAGLFVEDINLFRLCDLPGGEVSLASGNLRRPERGALERELRGRAEFARRTLERVAVQRRVSWSFAVTRGQMEEAVLGPVTEIDLVALSRRHRGFLSGAGEAKAGRQAVAALYRGGEGARRVLDVATRVAVRARSPLVLLLPTDDPATETRLREEIDAALRQSGLDFGCRVFRPSVQALAGTLAQARILVLEAGVARAIDAVLPGVGVDLLLVREPGDQPASSPST